MAAARSRPHLIRQTLAALGLFAILIAIGDFLIFAGRVSSSEAPEVSGEADAVVVLTGGPGRIPAGLELVERGMAERVLISGVSPGVALADIEANQGGPADIYGCCTDIGAWATSTITNAQEAGAWARGRGYRRLILVTSDYHMPRSLVEFRRALPDAEIIAWPVSSEAAREAGGTPNGFRLMVREWFKYRVAWLIRGQRRAR